MYLGSDRDVIQIQDFCPYVQYTLSYLALAPKGESCFAVARTCRSRDTERASMGRPNVSDREVGMTDLDIELGTVISFEQTFKSRAVGRPYGRFGL